LIVQTFSEGVRRQIRADVEMSDLREGMHARIGSPRSVQLEIAAARHLAHRAIDFTLNRLCVFLDLPAAVACARVFDRQLEPGHSISPRAEPRSDLSTRPVVPARNMPLP